MSQARKLSQLMSAEVSIEDGHALPIIQGLTADSRKVEPGFLFAALKGVKSDGRAFVKSAVEKGAVAILTEADGLDEPVLLPVLRAQNPRRALSLMAAAFYEKAPAVIAAVTGTAGKTSVAAFLRQIWMINGFEAASIGTVGVKSRKTNLYGSLTTPDPVDLQKTLCDLSQEGVSHLVLEASSHGLDQYRLDGVPVTMAAFTNLGRDHMDYHPTIADYFRAKMRLFEALLPKGAPAIVNPSEPYGKEACERMEKAGLRVFSVGEKGEAMRLCETRAVATGQRLTLDFGEGPREVLLPLVGRFQTANALTAAGLALASGVAPDKIMTALEGLVGESGRLEFIGRTDKGAPVFIDYAHKVEALENLLEALRPCAENHLIVVFGAGGDRDTGKRPLMGKVAHERADIVIVTDDNPRSEEAAKIRRDILAEVPGGIEIGDREAAIFSACERAQAGDVVVIAGKGHETGQIVGDTVLPFSDHDVVRRALRHEDA